MFLKTLTRQLTLQPVNNMILGITGHRPHKLGGYNDATNRSKEIKLILKKLFLQAKPTCVVSGMALGVDQWAAEVALDLGIKVLALIPCKGQESQWPDSSKKQYAALLWRIEDAGGSVEFVSNISYDPKLQQMQARNQKIVDYSTHLLAIWDGSWGGTGSCVRLAKKVGKSIVVVHPTTLEITHINEHTTL
jgi:uncharacterized phage-like protein YoqJ